MNEWQQINEELWNPYLTHEQNNENGCNLPPGDGWVLIYDSDKPKYFVGSIGTNSKYPNRLVVYESIKGDIYSTNIKYCYWKAFEFFEGE